MLFFPTTVVDNFFDNPDVVRDYALQQTYETNRPGVINGLRSKPLTQINPKLQEEVREKVLTLFYDMDRDHLETDIRSYFHKNIPYHKGDNMGWIHQDLPTSIIAGLVYLTPNPDPESGTSIFRKIKNVDQDTFKKAHDIKNVYIVMHILFMNQIQMTLIILMNLITGVLNGTNVMKKL